MLTAHLSAGRACKGPARRRITRPLPTAGNWLLIEGTIYRIQEEYLSCRHALGGRDRWECRSDASVCVSSIDGQHIVARRQQENN
jgi:hypothetical protein